MILSNAILSLTVFAARFEECFLIQCRIFSKSANAVIASSPSNPTPNGVEGAKLYTTATRLAKLLAGQCMVIVISVPE